MKSVNKHFSMNHFDVITTVCVCLLYSSITSADWQTPNKDPLNVDIDEQLSSLNGSQQQEIYNELTSMIEQLKLQNKEIQCGFEKLQLQTDVHEKKLDIQQRAIDVQQHVIASQANVMDRLQLETGSQQQIIDEQQEVIGNLTDAINQLQLVTESHRQIMDEQQQLNENQGSAISDLTSDLDSQQTTTNEHASFNAWAETQLDQLQQDNDLQQQTIDQQQEVNLNHTAFISNLQLANESLHQSIEEINDVMTEYEEIVTSLTSEPDFVGFSTYVTGNQEPDKGEPVLFEGVTTNAGDAYNSTTSIFTCPTSAFYYVYFHLSLNSDDGYDSCYMNIMLDGTRVVEAVEKSYDGVRRVAMTSTSAVLECQAGSQVWVESRSDQCLVYGHGSLQRSSFGGFQLQPI